MNIIGKTSQSSLKVCGICRTADLQFCLELGVPYLGFNFFNGSKRYIAPKYAKEQWNQCVGSSFTSKAVGVFVDASHEEILAACQQFSEMTVIQLHGAESAEFVESLRLLLSPGMSVWKALTVNGAGDLRVAAAYEEHCEMILLDGQKPGSGNSFDWSLLTEFRTNCPGVVLAGGISLSNISEALRLGPDVVDVASGCETKPRIKDPDKIREMMKVIKIANDTCS